jgi:hypothetical protein
MTKNFSVPVLPDATTQGALPCQAIFFLQIEHPMAHVALVRRMRVRVEVSKPPGSTVNSMNSLTFLSLSPTIFFSCSTGVGVGVVVGTMEQPAEKWDPQRKRSRRDGHEM